MVCNKLRLFAPVALSMNLAAYSNHVTSNQSDTCNLARVIGT